MTAIGAIAYINSFSEAISSRSWLWALDHLLAPLFGALLTIWVMLPFYIHQLIPTMQTLAHRQSFLDLGVGFCVSILWWVFAFGGPVLAVMGMNSDDWVRRRSSYVGFFLTAATWGVLLAIAIRPPHG
jgi:hypothetical protein